MKQHSQRSQKWKYDSIFDCQRLIIQAETQVAKETFTTLGKRDEMPLFSSRKQKYSYLV